VCRSFESNLEYMWQHFGFYLPDAQYLKDPEGLVKYLVSGTDKYLFTAHGIAGEQVCVLIMQWISPMSAFLTPEAFHCWALQFQLSCRSLPSIPTCNSLLQALVKKACNTFLVDAH